MLFDGQRRGDGAGIATSEPGDNALDTIRHLRAPPEAAPTEIPEAHLSPGTGGSRGAADRKTGKTGDFDSPGFCELRKSVDSKSTGFPDVQLWCMAGRKPLLEHELPAVYAALAEFPLRDQALIALGLNTGFRITELLSLDVAHVWENGRMKSQVKVTRSKMKGGNGRHRKAITSRTVPLNEAAVSTLEKYLFARFGSGPMDLVAPLFPSRFHGMRLTRWRANIIVHQVLVRAGLENQEVYGSHTLRKTFARAIYKATNHDINLTRAVMGHSYVTTTQKYLHVDEVEIQIAVLSLPKIQGLLAPSLQNAANG